ncbi:hypothetical protein OEZ86_012507 [Tetradesmus obliquus]|nr:hypothetical protein OEZ86_012507 [Tetradesmus obliquus]
MKQQPHELVTEVLENHIWIGLGVWREAFVVPFITGTVPAWSDACFSPIQWDSPPKCDGDQGWQVVCSAATDAEGWIYGTAFDHLQYERPGGRASKRVNDRVRSRLWRRVQQQQDYVAPQQQQQHQHQQQAQPRLSNPSTARQLGQSAAAAAGHMSSIGNALKLLATLPLFDPITGVSLQANTQALMSLAGFDASDVLLTAWDNDTFRPCHYVAVDRARQCLVLGVRGSLEVGDLETDITAAPLAFEFQGVAGWVHEGLLAAAAFVVANTVDALAEGSARHPGWPLVVAGHSLGGGVAALVTLLLQQPGAAPRSCSGVRCVCIGPAAVLSEELCAMCEQYITTVVVGADVIPRLSTYSVESLLLDLVNASISRRAAASSG